MSDELKQPQLCYYEVELECSECGYSTSFVIGPEIIASGDDDMKPRIPVRNMLLYCASKKELLSMTHRYSNIREPGEDICNACGEEFKKQTFFEAPTPGVKHCWGPLHLELDYTTVINPSAEIGIPCPKCKEKHWNRRKLQRHIR